jgi:hypothetical protein
MSRRDRVTFFFGTAMILLAQNKRQPFAAAEWRVHSQNPTLWQVKHASSEPGKPMRGRLFFQY